MLDTDVEYNEIALPRVLDLVKNATKKNKEGKLLSPFHPKAVPYTALTRRFLNELEIVEMTFQPEQFFVGPGSPE